jgi:hypothetical protein
MDTDKSESAKRAAVSRRRFLRSTANLTAGAVAVSTVSFGETEAKPLAESAIAPDHDPETGEIFDRERHHHWDTV